MTYYSTVLLLKVKQDMICYGKILYETVTETYHLIIVKYLMFPFIFWLNLSPFFSPNIKPSTGGIPGAGGEAGGAAGGSPGQGFNLPNVAG